VPAAKSITEFVRNAAREAGFELCGVAGVGDFAELKFFPEWIEAGRAGEMKYLEARDEAGQLKRASLARAAPWARSVIVCAINYNTAEPYSTQVRDAERGWISRYAWSREDYHDAVMRRLRVVEARLREATETTASVKEPRFRGVNSAQKDAGLQPPRDDGELITRCYVDTGPLVERVYAKYAGVGWIGKNTCIINQKIGSWIFLGVILTSLEVASSEDAHDERRFAPSAPAPDRCGTCTRCIEACPTDAIVAPYQLDANLCISYLTIEKRGEIPDAMRAGIGRHVFGCDICQDVCPWNRKAPATAVTEFQPREGLVNPALAWLAEISPEEFRDKFRSSPIRRTKRSGVRRNAVIAIGNSGNEEFVPLLEKLCGDEDEVVAESARWALNHISHRGEAQVVHKERGEPGAPSQRDSI